MKDYDQQYIRRTEDRWKNLGSRLICEVCGRKDNCKMVNAMQNHHAVSPQMVKDNGCGAFIPVLSFQGRRGLTEFCNTFRRGSAWERRGPVGSRIAFYDLTTSTLFGYGSVHSVFVAPLAALLTEHASSNHMMQGRADSQEALGALLIRLYGKSYAALDATFTALYIQPDKGM